MGKNRKKKKQTEKGAANAEKLLLYALWYGYAPSLWNVVFPALVEQ